MSDVLVFNVNGTPGAQGSKRHVGHGVMIESSKKVKPWRTDVKTAAEHATGNVAHFDPWTPHTGPVHITPEQWKTVPTYTVQQYPVFTAPTYHTEIYRYYGLTPGEQRRAFRRAARAVD